MHPLTFEPSTPLPQHPLEPDVVSVEHIPEREKIIVRSTYYTVFHKVSITYPLFLSNDCDKYDLFLIYKMYIFTEPYELISVKKNQIDQ